MDKNVVLFPTERIVRPSNTPVGQGRIPTNLDEIKSNLTMVNHVYINELLEQMIPQIVNQLEAAGFDISSEENIKDGAFLVEAFRSLLSKQYGIQHPFQKIADKIFTEDEDGELRVVPKIEVELGNIE